MTDQGETSMAQLTRAQILARKTGSDIVTFEDGTTIKVRGLTRAEAAVMRKFEEEHPEDIIGLEALALSMGITAPKLSAEDARQWLEQDGHGEIQKAVTAVQVLSGNAPGQSKEYLKSVS